MGGRQSTRTPGERGVRAAVQRSKRMRLAAHTRARRTTTLAAIEEEAEPPVGVACATCGLLLDDHANQSCRCHTVCATVLHNMQPDLIKVDDAAEHNPAAPGLPRPRAGRAAPTLVPPPAARTPAASPLPLPLPVLREEAADAERDPAGARAMKRRRTHCRRPAATGTAWCFGSPSTPRPTPPHGVPKLLPPLPESGGAFEYAAARSAAAADDAADDTDTDADDDAADDTDTDAEAEAESWSEVRAHRLQLHDHAEAEAEAEDAWSEVRAAMAAMLGTPVSFIATVPPAPGGFAASAFAPRPPPPSPTSSDACSLRLRSGSSGSVFSDLSSLSSPTPPASVSPHRRRRARTPKVFDGHTDWSDWSDWSDGGNSSGDASGDASGGGSDAETPGGCSLPVPLSLPLAAPTPRTARWHAVREAMASVTSALNPKAAQRHAPREGSYEWHLAAALAWARVHMPDSGGPYPHLRAVSLFPGRDGPGRGHAAVAPAWPGAGAKEEKEEEEEWVVLGLRAADYEDDEFTKPRHRAKVVAGAWRRPMRVLRLTSLCCRP